MMLAVKNNNHSPVSSTSSDAIGRDEKARSTNSGKGADKIDPVFDLWAQYQSARNDWFVAEAAAEDAYDALPGEAKDATISLPGIYVSGNTCRTEEEIKRLYMRWIKAMEKTWGERWIMERRHQSIDKMNMLIEQLQEKQKVVEELQKKLGYIALRKKADIADQLYDAKRETFLNTPAITPQGLKFHISLATKHSDPDTDDARDGEVYRLMQLINASLSKMV